MRWLLVAGLLVFVFAGPAQVYSAQEHTVSNITYVESDGKWAVRDPSGRVSPNKVNTQQIVLRVDKTWTPAQLEQNKIPLPTRVSDPLFGEFVAVDVPPGVDPIDYIRQLESSPGVSFARFDIKIQWFAIPNDPLFSDQWGHQESFSHLPSAWDLSTGAGVDVAIIDTGVDAGHRDLKDVVTYSDSPPNCSSDPVGCAHGTAVAGIVGAVTDNGRGVAGVAGGWHPADGVRLMSLNVFASMNPDAMAIAARIQFAADFGAEIINISGGWDTGDDAEYPEVAAAIDYATARDVLICCATGNATARPMAYPASNAKTMAVAAIGPDEQHGGGFGAALDILAPGWYGVVTTDMRGADGYSSTDYTCDDGAASCFGGTSASTPFCSGVAALVRSANPALTWSEVRDIIRYTADKMPGMNGKWFDQRYGYGRINAYQAVKAALAIPADGMITTSTTWSDKIVLTRDVLVAEGATLTIAAGTDVVFALSDAQDLEPFFADRVELHARGNLVINGDASNSVRFFSGSPSPTDADWVHIQVLGSGSLAMDYAEVRHAEWGISTATTSAISIANSTFDSNMMADVRFFNGPSSAIVDHCNFDVGSGVGIDVMVPGVVISNTSMTTDASSSYAIGLDDFGATATIDSDTLIGTAPTPTGSGIFVGRGNTTIQNCEITGFDRGIDIKDGTHTIGVPGLGNTIAGNTTGLYVRCQRPGPCPSSCNLNVVARDNTIDSNMGDGVLIGKIASTGTVVDLGTASDPGGNSVVGNGGYCISYTASCSTVPAVGNYFGDCPVPPGCINGNVDASDPLCGAPLAIAAGLDPTPEPDHTALLSTVPNPFNPTTTIHFGIAQAAASRIVIYDVAGRRVREHDLGYLPVGFKNWKWDGRDQKGQTVKSGVYFIVLRSGSVFDTQKAVLLK